MNDSIKLSLLYTNPCRVNLTEDVAISRCSLAPGCIEEKAPCAGNLAGQYAGHMVNGSSQVDEQKQLEKGLQEYIGNNIITADKDIMPFGIDDINDVVEEIMKTGQTYIEFATYLASGGKELLTEYPLLSKEATTLVDKISDQINELEFIEEPQHIFEQVDHIVTNIRDAIDMDLGDLGLIRRLATAFGGYGYLIQATGDETQIPVFMESNTFTVIVGEESHCSQFPSYEH